MDVAEKDSGDVTSRGELRHSRQEVVPTMRAAEFENKMLVRLAGESLDWMPAVYNLSAQLSWCHNVLV